MKPVYVTPSLNPFPRGRDLPSLRSKADVYFMLFYSIILFYVVQAPLFMQGAGAKLVPVKHRKEERYHRCHHPKP